MQYRGHEPAVGSGFERVSATWENYQKQLTRRISETVLKEQRPD